MITRTLALSLTGLLVAGSIGCNEIVGIKAAEENEDLAASCDPSVDIGEQRAVGCMFRIACDPYLPPYNMSECVSLAWQDASPAESCTFGAETCAEVDACIGRRYEPASSCEGESGWICDEDGGRAINCTDDGGYSVDCALFGATCAPHASTADPTAYACQTSSPPTCPADAEEGEYFCEGTQRFTCIGGEPYGVDCAETSSDCVEFSPGSAYCTDRTDTCDDPNSIHCDGDAIQICDQNGYAARFDCSSEGLTCDVDSDSENITCLAASCETTAACKEECLDDGVRMRFCAGGEPYFLNCTDYGFDGCLEGSIKQGTPLAYCALETGATPHP
jgi:hypothetical protein